LASYQPKTQVALLRVLQEREFERVGGNQRIRANARVVALRIATWTRPSQRAPSGAICFTGSNVFPIEIPALRIRKRGHPRWLSTSSRVSRGSRKAQSAESAKKTLDLLLSYPWPATSANCKMSSSGPSSSAETETFSVDESWLSDNLVRHSRPRTWTSRS